MKTFFFIMITIWAAVSALLIPQVFIHSTFIKHQLDKVLHLEVDPAFSGGREIAHFLDPVNDDYGEGCLSYPKHKAYTHKSGLLDLVKYSVYKPQTNARWSSEVDYIQVSFTFAKVNNDLESIHGFSHPIIHLYLDVDGKRGGKTETAFSRCELVRFDENHPWDFLIIIHGFHKSAKIISDDGMYQDRATIFADSEKKTLKVRIPLVYPKLKQILDGRNTYHYVLVGAYDPLSKGCFMPVKAKAGLKYGGGARSALSPRVYDYIPPEGKDQKQLLSSYDEDNFTYATIFPLEVTADLYIKDEKNIDPAKLAKMKKQVEQEAKAEYAENIIIIESTHSTSNTEDIKLAIALFNIQRLTEAEKLLDKILTKNPDHAVANAYKGVVTSQKAQLTENITEKIQYVEQSFVYLNRGAALARSDDERINCFICRAEVFMAIPEDVFAKNKNAEQDLTAVIELLEKQEQKNHRMIADMYIKLALCYLNQAEHDDAEIAFLKARSQPELSARAMLELVERGY